MEEKEDTEQYFNGKRFCKLALISVLFIVRLR